MKNKDLNELAKRVVNNLKDKHNCANAIDVDNLTYLRLKAKIEPKVGYHMDDLHKLDVSLVPEKLGDTKIGALLEKATLGSGELPIDVYTKYALYCNKDNYSAVISYSDCYADVLTYAAKLGAECGPYVVVSQPEYDGTNWLVYVFGYKPAVVGDYGILGNEGL